MKMNEFRGEETTSTESSPLPVRISTSEVNGMLMTCTVFVPLPFAVKADPG